MQTQRGESLIRGQAYVTSMLMRARGHKQLLETGMNQRTVKEGKRGVKVLQTSFKLGPQVCGVSDYNSFVLARIRRRRRRGVD